MGIEPPIQRFRRRPERAAVTTATTARITTRKGFMPPV
jgi:hypothetical protein